MDALILKLRRLHRGRFGLEPAIVSYAPGRIEILGNHTDYNEGFVLSAAIDAGIAFGLNASGTPAASLFAADFDESVEFAADHPGRTDRERWSNYARGVYSLMREKYRFEPRGFLATQIGDIPIGSGLSSSAALDIAKLRAQRLARSGGVGGHHAVGVAHDETEKVRQLEQEYDNDLLERGAEEV